MIDPLRLQVLIDVLGRAPATRAEQLIIQEVVDQLIGLATPAPVTDQATPNMARSPSVVAQTAENGVPRV